MTALAELRQGDGGDRVPVCLIESRSSRRPRRRRRGRRLPRASAPPLRFNFWSQGTCAQISIYSEL